MDKIKDRENWTNPKTKKNFETRIFKSFRLWTVGTHKNMICWYLPLNSKPLGQVPSLH